MIMMDPRSLAAAMPAISGKVTVTEGPATVTYDLATMRPISFELDEILTDEAIGDIEDLVNDILFAFQKGQLRAQEEVQKQVLAAFPPEQRAIIEKLAKGNGSGGQGTMLPPLF